MMWKQLQAGTLALFVLFAVLTLFCQLRCGMLSGRIARGEAGEETLAHMRLQGKRASLCAFASLLVCILCGALRMR